MRNKAGMARSSGAAVGGLDGAHAHLKPAALGQRLVALEWRSPGTHPPCKLTACCMPP